jgi:DNA repair exonuclease SbcCD ATPase subunit
MDKGTQLSEETNGEARKRGLEIRKLDTEIRQLQLPWWKKPSYLGAILPVAVATLTIAGAVFTGYFDAQRVRLQNEKKELEENVDTLQNEKKKLTENVQNLRSAGAKLIAHFRQTLRDLERIAGRKSDELKKLLNSIGTQNEKEITENASKIRDLIEKINRQVGTGKKMLNELPSFE